MGDLIDTSLARVLALTKRARDAILLDNNDTKGPEVLDELLTVFGSLRGQLERAETAQRIAEHQTDMLQLRLMQDAARVPDPERWVLEPVRLVLSSDDLVMGGADLHLVTRREPSSAVLLFGVLIIDGHQSEEAWTVRSVRVGVREQMPERVFEIDASQFRAAVVPPLVLRDVQDGQDIAVILRNERKDAAFKPPKIQILGLLRRPKTVAELGGNAG